MPIHGSQIYHFKPYLRNRTRSLGNEVFVWLSRKSCHNPLNLMYQNDMDGADDFAASLKVRFKPMRGGHILRKLFPSLAELFATVRFRTYLEDGLITRHTADFLSDPKFSAAYAKGKATNSWGNTNPRWRVYTACWAASQAANLPGDFVECGVNRGGMALTIMEYLNFNALEKRFFLLDTYSGFASGSQPASANKGQ